MSARNKSGPRSTVKGTFLHHGLSVAGSSTVVCLFLLQGWIGITDVAAQEFDWARHTGATSGPGEVGGVALDTSGNVYSVGTFSGTGDFDPGPGIFTLTSFGGRDAYLSKLDGSGNFLWAVVLGGTGEDQAHGVAVDSTGNVYVVGFFSGTADFDPGPGIYPLTSLGLGDVFISKLDSNGDLVWAAHMGGASTLTTDFCKGVALDSVGSVYTVGYFFDTADFDPGPGTFNLTSVGDSDVFVAKLDNGGNFIWAVQLGGPTFDAAYAVALDGGGNIYTVGTFSSTADFDPGLGLFQLVSVGAQDGFISKLDSNGTFSWATQLGGTLNDRYLGIAIDASSSIQSVGAFEGTADFDPGIASYNLTSAGAEDIFVSKFDLNGNLTWAVQMGGISRDFAIGVAIDASSNIYTAGYFFGGTADFDPGAGTYNLTAASDDVFISKLDSSGGFLWAKQVGSPSSERVSGVAVYGSSVYTKGRFQSTVDFDPGPGTYNLSTATLGSFVLKLSPCSSFSCDDGNVCTDDSCDLASGCIYTDDDSNTCADGNACTTPDVCVSGNCVGGAPVSCNDGIACTDDSCNPASGCMFTPVDSHCDDSNDCTVDVCSAATGCANTPVACAATSACCCERTIVRGTNLVTFPMITNLMWAKDVCTLFGKTTNATQILQYDGTSLSPWLCGLVGNGFALKADKGIGVMIKEFASPGTGMIWGTHDPSQIVTIPAAGFSPKGRIVYAYPYSDPYRSCDEFVRDICVEAGLTTGPVALSPDFVRYGPAGTVDGTFNCAIIAVPGFALRYCGEGVLISNETNGPKQFVPQVPPCN